MRFVLFCGSKPNLQYKNNYSLDLIKHSSSLPLAPSVSFVTKTAQCRLLFNTRLPEALFFLTALQRPLVVNHRPRKRNKRPWELNSHWEQNPKRKMLSDRRLRNKSGFSPQYNSQAPEARNFICCTPPVPPASGHMGSTIRSGCKEPERNAGRRGHRANSSCRVFATCPHSSGEKSFTGQQWSQFQFPHCSIVS